MDEGFEKKRKIVIGAIVAFFVVIVLIWIGNLIWNKIYSATANIMVVPSIAKVKIGESEYKTIEECKMKPGTYKVEVSAEGFKTKTGEVTFAEGETTRVHLYLLPEDPNNDWYDKHPDEKLVYGEIGSAEAREKLEKLKEENPILGKLPLEIDYFTAGYAKRVRYTISYEANEDYTDFTILITDYTGGNRQAALDKLTARGADVSKLKIEYKEELEEDSWGHA